MLHDELCDLLSAWSKERDYEDAKTMRTWLPAFERAVGKIAYDARMKNIPDPVSIMLVIHSLAMFYLQKVDGRAPKFPGTPLDRASRAISDNFAHTLMFMAHIWYPRWIAEMTRHGSDGSLCDVHYTTVFHATHQWLDHVATNGWALASRGHATTAERPDTPLN